MSDSVLRLFPTPAAEEPLRGLYLAEDLRRFGAERPFVYTNFIVSLDGRIAELDPDTGRKGVPPAIANRRDWGLFLELAAQSDVLLTTAQNVRAVVKRRHTELITLTDDLMEWRQRRGLTARPRVAVISESLRLPPAEALPPELCERLLVITSARGDPGVVAQLESVDVPVERVGPGPGLSGHEVLEALQRHGLQVIYSIAGARVHHTLLGSGVLDRLYLTVAHRVLGGEGVDTLVWGAPLQPPSAFALQSLYLDAESLDGAGQLFAGYQRLEAVERTL
ncbi:RibD family protein [Thiohalomonas denitrificans]|uniref:Pyrimidine reductase, riboflavin biosynthesis n=1 Tax=Thiohalomonas denitrificans TaxID=415747 RepID=A0A1G5Q7J4_9GAMM|nr:dihydrofolate reductase family protein [Thiohalomonas denitrificans]SCZ57834.1 Pyrimidine reductase, riboflavin biosynthesis [Thiohalomonas denitrificans]